MSGTDKQKVLYLLLLLFNRVYEKAQGILCAYCALFAGPTAYFFLTFLLSTATSDILFNDCVEMYNSERHYPNLLKEDSSFLLC